MEYMEEHGITKFWPLLSRNPSAVKYLYQDPSLIKKGTWFKNKNPAIIPLIEDCSYINSPWVQEQLLENPNALHLVKSHHMKHNLYNLCKNTNPLAINIIDYHIDQSDSLSEVIWNTIGTNPSALPIIEKHFDKMSWKSLSENPAAIHILLKNPSRIDWHTFSKNTHPLAIEHMRKNLDKVSWQYMNMNPAAIEILKENPDKIDGYWISVNPGIFEYNYTKMAKARLEYLRDELLSVSLHPSRISKLLKQGLTLAEI
jgi:hypothetical protein